MICSEVGCWQACQSELEDSVLPSYTNSIGLRRRTRIHFPPLCLKSFDRQIIGGPGSTFRAVPWSYRPSARDGLRPDRGQPFACAGEWHADEVHLHRRPHGHPLASLIENTHPQRVSANRTPSHGCRSAGKAGLRCPSSLAQYVSPWLCWRQICRKILCRPCAGRFQEARTWN